MTWAECWKYTFGTESHLNLPGKIVLGVLVGWLWVLLIAMFKTMSFLFDKRTAQ